MVRPGRFKDTNKQWEVNPFYLTDICWTEIVGQNRPNGAKKDQNGQINKVESIYSMATIEKRQFFAIAANDFRTQSLILMIHYHLAHQFYR